MSGTQEITVRVSKTIQEQQFEPLTAEVIIHETCPKKKYAERTQELLEQASDNVFGYLGVENDDPPEGEELQGEEGGSLEGGEEGGLEEGGEGFEGGEEGGVSGEEGGVSGEEGGGEGELDLGTVDISGEGGFEEGEPFEGGEEGGDFEEGGEGGEGGEVFDGEGVYEEGTEGAGGSDDEFSDFFDDSDPE